MEEKNAFIHDDDNIEYDGDVYPMMMMFNMCSPDQAMIIWVGVGHI